MSQQIRINIEDVTVSIPTERVIQEVLRTMETRQSKLFERSPGFIAVGSLSGYASSPMFAETVKLANHDEARWERVEKALNYMRTVGASLNNGGQAMGVYQNGAIAAAGNGGKKLQDIWGNDDQALFNQDDLAEFLNAAAQLQFGIPTFDEVTEKSGAQILREKAQDVADPDSKAFAALCLVAERFTETQKEEDRLTGQDVIEAYRTLRADSSELTSAPQRVRTAVETYGHGRSSTARGSNGQQQQANA